MEWIRILGGAKPAGQGAELQYALRGLSNEELRTDFAPGTLERAYVFEDRSAIRTFIKRNRLLELLLEAQEPLNSAFGEAAVKKLTLVEDDEGFVTLFCLILVPGALEDAWRALNSFDESWWLARSGRVRGKLNFDLDLV
jgi:hypothetical protein